MYIYILPVDAKRRRKGNRRGELETGNNNIVKYIYIYIYKYIYLSIHIYLYYISILYIYIYIYS